MKKITIFILVLTCSIVAAYSQSFIKGLPSIRYHEQNSGIPYNLPYELVSNNMNKKASFSAWYDFVSSFSQATGNNFTSVTNNFILFPDTFAKVIYLNANGTPAPSYTAWNSVGSCFNPTDSVFSMDSDTNDAISDTTGYTADSVEYLYFYDRHTVATVKDTLVIQCKKLVAADIFTNTNTHEPLGTVDFDIQKGIAKGMDTTYRIILTSKDTSARGFKLLKLPVRIKCKPGETVATTITYFPGVTYKVNDTVEDFYAKDIAKAKPHKKINAFGVLVNLDKNVSSDLDYRPNNGLVVNAQQRYNIDFVLIAGAPAKYLFGKAFAFGLYPRALYKITTDTTHYVPVVTTGIAKVKASGIQVNFYPNPSTGHSYLDFSLDKSSSISVDIFNVLGQKLLTPAIGNYTSGKHRLDVNTSSLAPGVYYFTLGVNGIKETRKFIVSE